MAGDSPVRASDADRERAVAALREASADGRMTLEEFSQRMDVALNAVTHGELQALMADLHTPTSPVAPKRWIIDIFGGGNRRGRWTLGSELNVIDIFGGSSVDLREATITASQVTITAVAIFGGADITVPDGADVDLSGWALFGGNDLKVRSRPVEGVPRIRVRAFSLFGGIDVLDKPGEAVSPQS